MYLLIINHKVDDYAQSGLLWSLSVFIKSTVIWERVHDFQLGVESYHQQVNLTAPTITFPGIEKYKVFSIVSEPVYGIIYKNSKKEKRVMSHQEVYKLCDATLKRALEGLKSYNNDVNYGYVTHSLSKEDVEYLQLFAEEIEERLKIPQAPDRYRYYVDVEEYEVGGLDKPPNYKAALANPESDIWLEAMNTKMQSMKDNQVWYLVDLPSNGRTVGCKWLFKKKTDIDGNVHTFKARLVAKGFTQTYRVDYGETFSPIADIRAIRILLAITAFYDYEI
ncbi:putative retrotransposon ty1-copia subclass protein [Tanacetum coccineum]|uniref:Retrotransposon ty1-copia subclass protein n=1 Tax=Tanacetum coccineum TaxID=301880 RepID=A0ABQ5D426_9ASTR